MSDTAAIPSSASSRLIPPSVAPTARTTSTSDATSFTGGKYYCSYNQVHNLCQQAAKRIREDKFQPDIILAVAGGGLIPARMLRTHLKVPIRTVSLELYDDRTNKAGSCVRTTQWIDREEICNKRVLIVDEVDDSRTTLAFCVSQVRQMSPSQLGVFVVHNKQKVKKCNSHWKSVGFQENCDCSSNGNNSDHQSTSIDYYRSGEDLSDRWIVYPWDSTDIDTHTKCAEQVTVTH